MGWLFKGFLAFVAISAFGIGLWPISLGIFVYLIFGSRLGKRKVERVIVIAPSGAAAEAGQERESRERGSRLGFQWRWRYLLGGLLLLAAFLAVGAHGTFSPLVFGGLGALCFLWAPLSRGGHTPAIRYSPLRESTLLRSVLVPFQWLTVVELKLSTQESARALSVLRNDLVMMAPSSERPAMYLVVKEMAVGYKGAEAAMSEKLGKLAGLLANRGAYLMPLDSLEAVRRFHPGLEVVNLDMNRNSVLEAVGHSPYDVLVVKPDGVHAKSLGAYRASQSGREEEVERFISGQTGPALRTEAVPATSGAILPSARQSFERQPLLWEVISCLQERFHFSEPDAYTMFLNNMHLSRGVSPGQKMTLASGGAAGEISNGSTLTVESLGGAPVALTRAQLRMVVRMYG